MAMVTAPLPDTLSAAIHELLRGQDSAKKIRDLLAAVNSVTSNPVKEELDVNGGRLGLADLVGDVLRSFTSTLSILNQGGDCSDEVSPGTLCRAVKSEESEESSYKSSAPRERRGCYKRRKNSDSWTKLSPNFADDGHQWRKYGQKIIQNKEFPRSYFRCTHKLDQGCSATKQVQKISENPPIYQTIYHGHHTCRNLLKSPQILLADDDSYPRDSSFLLCFETDKSPNTTNNNSHKIIPFSCSLAPSSIVKSETKEGIVTKQLSPSSEYEGFPSPDFTGFDSTIGSDQGSVLSSNRSFDDHNMDFMIDGVDFDDMLDSLTRA